MAPIGRPSTPVDAAMVHEAPIYTVPATLHETPIYAAAHRRTASAPSQDIDYSQKSFAGNLIIVKC